VTARQRAGRKALSRPRSGRPSRADAARLADRILDVATEMFFAEGYGATSIDAIARRARISKRTFYHRFPDKAALFEAVIHRIVDKLRPPANIPLFEGGSLDEILRRLARLILRAALAPMALALNRLMVAEARRFPELAAVATREGSRDEAVRLIAGLIEREARAAGLAIDRPQFAAEQFLEFVIAAPRRRALGLGTAMTEAELDAWADDCVNLFVNGCRHWQSRAAGSERK
jgi:TetR/AcrR family transcriptional regulator, mexJK operon transcriptional repressor